VKILVTGRDGQVARSLAQQGAGRDLVFAGRPEFDLADGDSIARTIAQVHPDLVISAAAYTAVDQAEDEPDLAMAINGEAPGLIGRAAAAIGAPVIHLSTDYVFDGSGNRPWREDDPTQPIGVYGKSKLAGERALAASGASYAIVRSAWIYSPFGNNFVKTMLRLAETRDTLGVVSDQHGNPTCALDIADALLAVADRWQENPRHGIDQVYHFAGTGATDWATFARAIFAAGAAHGGPHCDVESITSAQYPTRADRPANSRLDCTKFERTFGLKSPPWRTSLEQVVETLLA